MNKTPGLFFVVLVLLLLMNCPRAYASAQERKVTEPEYGEPFTTFEGIRITADYSFETAPSIDILVIPSIKTSRTSDLKNEVLLQWIRKWEKEAQYVMTLCWGAFPLDATGALDGKAATTFPGDNRELAPMFPKVDVKSRNSTRREPQKRSRRVSSWIGTCEISAITGRDEGRSWR